MSDFRGAHGTLASLIILITSSYVINSSGSSASSLSTSVSRNFALPLAWTTIIYVLVFGRYARILERRFGTSRFVQIYFFLGGVSSVIAQSLFNAILLPQLLPTAASSSVAQRLVSTNSPLIAAFSIPHWNPLLVALSTFAAFRIPSSRRATATINNSFIRSFIYPYLPVVFSSGSVFLNQWMQANRNNTASSSAVSGGVGIGGSNLISRVALSTLFSVIPGVAVGASLHFYRPILAMLNAIADHSSVQLITDTILRSGRNEVYLRQEAANVERQQRAQEAQNQQHIGGGVGGGGDGARNLLHGDTEEEQMRQALIASIRQQRQAQNQGGGSPFNSNATARTAAAAAASAANRGGGVSAATTNNNNNNNQNQRLMQQQQRPATPQEKESIQFLKDMTGDVNADENHLLGVLRSVGGDTNQAATLLLGM